VALQPYIRIHGAPVCIAALRELARRAGRQGLRRAMWWLARTIQQDYINVVPVDTGLSKRFLRYGVYQKQGLTIAWIGPTAKSPANRQGKRPFDYLHFPDHGTKNIRAQRFAGKAFRRGSARVKPLIDTMIWDAIRRSRKP
jgi:hypothetical protein